jgi:hypothetical protein
MCKVVFQENILLDENKCFWIDVEVSISFWEKKYVVFITPVIDGHKEEFIFSPYITKDNVYFDSMSDVQGKLREYGIELTDDNAVKIDTVLDVKLTFSTGTFKEAYKRTSPKACGLPLFNE